MELGYVLLALDVVLLGGLVFVYRARRGDGVVLERLREERAALDDAREAVLRAVDEAMAARSELERVQRRVERFTREWALAAASEKKSEAGPAEARVTDALRAMRRA